MFYGVGNSSRGKSALPLFIDYLKTIDLPARYSMRVVYFHCTLDEPK